MNKSTTKCIELLQSNKQQHTTTKPDPQESMDWWLQSQDMYKYLFTRGKNVVNSIEKHKW